MVRFSHRARKYLFRVCIHRSGWEVTGQNRRKWNCNREKGRGNIGWAEFHPNCFTGTCPWVQGLWNPFNVDWAIGRAPEVKNQGKKGSEIFEQRLSHQFHYQIEKSEVDLYETLKPSRMPKSQIWWNSWSFMKALQRTDKAVVIGWQLVLKEFTDAERNLQCLALKT